MEKIEINKNDEISWMETIIEKVISKFDITNNRIMMKTSEQHMIYILTLMSMLYKEKCYEEYTGEKLGEIDDISIEFLDEIIYELKQDLEEDIKNTSQTIYKYGALIKDYLICYLCRKNTNYILEKQDLEIIKKQKREKEYIEINPLNLNQMIYYNDNPLTEEEKIIAEINEYYVEAEQKYEEKTFQLSYVKGLMKKNNTDDELDDMILFIIRNTYQEVEQDPKNPKKNEIMFVVENKKVKPSDLISYFKENKKFSNMFLENFINYNLNIEEGRLEELKTKESYEKIKRLYKK